MDAGVAAFGTGGALAAEPAQPWMDPMPADAAEVIVAETQRLARRGIGMAEAAMAGARELRAWRHHPLHDAVDDENGARFYYHAHASSRCPANEHGHFHLFMPAPDGRGHVHLAGLSLDARGWPIRWFATNRWVTGETWCDAPAVTALLARFQPRVAGRLAPVARWLGAMVALHQPALARLLQQRDAHKTRALRGRDDETYFEDRAIDVIAESPIDLVARLREAGAPPRGRSRARSS